MLGTSIDIYHHMHVMSKIAASPMPFQWIKCHNKRLDLPDVKPSSLSTCLPQVMTHAVMSCKSSVEDWPSRTHTILEI